MRSKTSLSKTNDQSNSGPSKRSIREWLSQLIASGGQHDTPRRGRLLLETLETRQLLAGDVDLLATDTSDQLVNDTVVQQDTVQQDTLVVNGEAQGEAAPDLVAFARALDDAGVRFFGANWCPACTSQKELFEDGGDYLPFIEVTGPDRTTNSIGIAEGITNFPTWDFPNQVDRSIGQLSLQEISTLSGIAIPQSEIPTFAPIGSKTVEIGAPLHIPVDAYDPDGGPQTITVSVQDPSLIEATVLQGNRSIRIDMQGYGDMVFELFEQRAPDASGRVIELAQDNFYDGIIFHRVIDNFVLQAGDPTGTGSGGSALGDFDDDFHPDLQHTGPGILSYAKSGDDTNDSQFFITEATPRHLDFNHSVFGQLVEGEKVREAISGHATNSQGRPQGFDITIDSIDVFNDSENAVIMLKALGTTPGTTNVTVTVTDQDGNNHSEVVAVDVIADSNNAQPYLNDVVVPTTAVPNDSPTQIQLSATDVEGDVVTYTAVSSTAGVTASADSSGVVTLTPQNGFTGTASVLVGVQAAVNAGGNSDTQRIAVTFDSTGVSIPSTPILSAASDTGTSNSDGITSAGTLTFTVNGTVAGANVELVNTVNGDVLGLALASGASTTITTNNISADGEGTYVVAARQVVGGTTSGISTPVSIVYDSTGPTAVSSSAALQAVVGSPYTTNLSSPEESNGLRYAITSGPSGATIDAQTGEVSWTPTSSQLGSNAFTLSLTDAAGNVSTDTFAVQVEDAAFLAAFDLELVDSSGNAVTSLDIGDRFTMNIRVTDLRNLAEGFFTAYLDVIFDNTIIRPVPTATIQHGSDFPSLTQGAIANGLINEVGGGSSSIEATQIDTAILASLEFEAIANGVTTLRADLPDADTSDITLFGLNRSLQAADVQLGTASLAVGQSFAALDDTFSVVEDSGATTLDVLGNDFGTNITLVSVVQPTSGGSTEPADGNIVFTPDADFNGTTTFTYRIRDTDGIEADATVTVNVSAVNDPPIANADTFSVVENDSDAPLDVLANDSTAPDAGETLTITEVTAFSNGGSATIASDGQSVNYTPATDFTGTETFVYTVSDGQAVVETTVTVNVITADEGPNAVNDSFTINEDDVETSYDVTANDTPDNSGETFVIDSVRTPSQGGTARVSSDGSAFFYQPAANFFGTETVAYTLRDTGGGLSVATATFTVTGANDPPPVLNPVISLQASAGQSTVLTIAELPENVDGTSETLSFANLGTPTAGGTAEIDATTGSILYTPPSETFRGNDTFTYAVVDTAGLTRSGTITLEISDFSLRSILLSYDASVLSPGTFAASARLIGTDVLGQTVDVAPTVSDELVQFAELLPGSYQIEIPAVPFLIGGEQAQSIPLESAEDDGDATITPVLGRLRAEFLSIRDWLGSTSAESVLIAVAAGGDSVIANATEAATEITEPSASLSADAQFLTLNATDSAGADVQANLNADSSAVEIRGQEGDVMLFKVDVTNTNFTPSTVTNGSATAQGEQIAAVQVAPPAVSGANVVANDTLLVTNGTAQGEQVASAASTRVDAFVPALSDFLGNSDAVVLPTGDGDVWAADAVEAAAGVSSDVNPLVSVDTAMQSVTPELSLRASSEEAIVDADSDELESARKAAIDDAFASEI